MRSHLALRSAQSLHAALWAIAREPCPKGAIAFKNKMFPNSNDQKIGTASMISRPVLKIGVKSQESGERIFILGCVRKFMEICLESLLSSLVVNVVHGRLLQKSFSSNFWAGGTPTPQ
jgi:hypothetical protein